MILIIQANNNNNNNNKKEKQYAPFCFELFLSCIMN